MASNRSFWLRWHWRTGLAAAVFIVIIAATGLALNHARFLGLHTLYIDNPAILSFYDMNMPPDYIREIRSVRNGFIVETQDGSVVLEQEGLNQVEIKAEIARQYRGQGVTLEKLLFDLHTGALIGLPGKILSDLAALAMIFLAGTGFYNWLKRRKS